MAPKPRGDSVPPGVPNSFPQTTPPQMGADVGGWVLTAVSRLEASSGKLEARLDSIDSHLDKLGGTLDRIESEVRGHGKWLHTVQVVGVIIVGIFGWMFVNAVWPWLKLRLGIPS